MKEIIAFQTRDGSIFESREEASAYEEVLKEKEDNLIDRSINHPFTYGQIVYIAVRDAVRQCSVVEVGTDVFEEWNNTLQKDVCVKESYLELCDVHDADESNRYYAFRGNDILHIKPTWKELLAFPFSE